MFSASGKSIGLSLVLSLAMAAPSALAEGFDAPTPFSSANPAVPATVGENPVHPWAAFCFGGPSSGPSIPQTLNRQRIDRSESSDTPSAAQCAAQSINENRPASSDVCDTFPSDNGQNIFSGSTGLILSSHEALLGIQDFGISMSVNQNTAELIPLPVPAAMALLGLVGVFALTGKWRRDSELHSIAESRVAVSRG